MSTTTDQSPAADAPATLTLSPVLSARFALGWKHVAVCAWFAVFFVYLNYVPLFHSDIWGHVHYGKWMLEHGRLITEDPFMPLAAGMQAVNSAWAAQLIFAQVEAWGGPQFLSNLFALVVIATYAIYARVFYRLSGRLDLAIAGVLLVLFVGWSRHAIIRPEMFGGLSFALFWWMIVQGKPWCSRQSNATSAPKSRPTVPWQVWAGIPLLFAFWANVHGSFMVGLIALGCHALGRIIEVAWRSRSLREVFADRWVRRWTLLTELAIAATLVNPVGLDLIISTLQFGGNPNLRDVMEWFPLNASMFEALQFGITILMIIVLLRHSRQPVKPVAALLLLVFAAAVGPTVRMIGWYAPVLAVVMMPHAADVWQQMRESIARWRSTRRLPALAHRYSRMETAHSMLHQEKLAQSPATAHSDRVSENQPLTPGHFLPTLICGLMVWTAFAVTPVSEPLLSGKPRPLEKIHSRGTPLGVTAWLRENPPETLVFSPQWWGDWLCWDGPENLQVFVTTHIHLVPRRVWHDYMRVARGESGWQATLDRYGIETLVVDKELQRGFARKVRGSAAWKTVYEDPRAIVLHRHK